MKTKYIAESRIKNEKVDSKALAELLMLNALPESYIHPRDVGELREEVWLQGLPCPSGNKTEDQYWGYYGPFWLPLLVTLSYN